MTDIKSTIQQLLKNFSGSDENDLSANDELADYLSKNIGNIQGLTELSQRLDILYDFEKRYLELLKEHKEEIKFTANLQEDLRKERTKFFSESLREVSKSLQDTEVDNKIASLWIQELVNSYTSSLDSTNELVKENTLSMITELRNDSSKTKKDVAKTPQKKSPTKNSKEENK